MTTINPSTISSLGTCSICTLTLITDIYTTSCGHIYHGMCIQKLALESPSCPICRLPVEVESLIRIHPGSISSGGAGTSQPALLTGQELEALTLETFRTQHIILNQLALLGEKSVEQGESVGQHKVLLEDSGEKYRLLEQEKHKLEDNLQESQSENTELNVTVGKVTAENTEIRGRLEAHEATVGILQTLVEEHKADVTEATKRMLMLESEVEEMQDKYSEMESTMEKIDIIRYEVEDDEEQDKPLEDFIEDLIERNSSLKNEVKSAQTNIIDNECKMLDMEWNITTLKESLNDAHVNYAEQSAESRDLEDSLRTMQKLHNDQAEELSTLQTERDIYQSDIQGMLENLRNLEDTKVVSEESRRRSEALNQTYQQQLSETLGILQSLKKEKEDALMMLALKEDVIKTLQQSIEKTTALYTEKLDKISSNMGTVSEEEAKSNTREPDTTLQTIIESRFDAISENLEQKDNLVIHLMKENQDLQARLEGPERQGEAQEQVAELKKQNEALMSDLKKKKNTLEENELVISHLVSVVNRYAYSDKAMEETSPARPDRVSDSSNSSRRSIFGRKSQSLRIRSR